MTRRNRYSYAGLATLSQVRISTSRSRYPVQELPVPVSSREVFSLSVRLMVDFSETVGKKKEKKKNESKKIQRTKKGLEMVNTGVISSNGKKVSQ